MERRNLRCYAPDNTRHLPGGLEVAAPSGTCPPLGDFIVATLGCWMSGCVIYKTFGVASKVGLLVFLELT